MALVRLIRDAARNVPEVSCTAQVERMLMAKADVNEELHRDTALHWAVFRFKPLCLVIETLLAHGANVNQRDTSGKTPFLQMASYNTVHGLQSLIRFRADPYATTYQGCCEFTALDWELSSQEKPIEVAKFLFCTLGVESTGCANHAREFRLGSLRPTKVVLQKSLQTTLFVIHLPSVICELIFDFLWPAWAESFEKNSWHLLT